MSDEMMLDTDEQDTGLPDNRPLDEQAESLVRRVKRLRKEADKHQAAWRREAKTDFAFLSGDQWSQEEKTTLEDFKRVAVVFNRIEPTIESIAGHEVNNRQAVKYLPRQPTQDSQLNELLTSAADWVRDQCDAEDEESDAFVDMLACGIGATDTRLSYDDNPDGDILIERIDPFAVRWDPAARKRNLADARWVQHDREMTLAEIKAEWPDKAEEIESASLTPEDGDVEGDETPHNATLAPFYEKDQASGEKSRSTRTVTCHQEVESVPYWRVADPTTGELVEFDDEQYAQLQAAAKQGLVAPPAQAVRLRKKHYKTSYLCGPVLLSTHDSVTQAGFTINFMTGRRDRNKNEWYGVVRMMRDPQRFANKYLSQLEALTRGSAKGGLLAEESATDNKRDLEDKWAQQDSVIWLNDGALASGKVQPKPVSPLPPGPERLLEFSINSIRDVTGVNQEALGLADRNQPGILELHRKESALTILAPLFNSLRRYRKVQGRVLADMIVRWISDGRLIRITNGDGVEQAIPLLRMPETLEYDVVVDSSSNAPDQKARTFAVLGMMIPALQSSGFPVPPEILEYSPLPQSLVQKWRAAIQEKAKQPPPVPPEVQKAQIQVQADVHKHQSKLAFDQWKAQADAKLEVYKATLAAQTKAQTEQLYAAINEQSQIINARANEAKAAGDVQKAQAEALKARIEGLAKIVDATTKARAQAEKSMEGFTKGLQSLRAMQADAIEPPTFEVVRDEAGDIKGVKPVKQQVFDSLLGAISGLQQSLSAPRKPLRVIRDENGDIQGVQ